LASGRPLTMSIESLDDISFSEDEENSKPEGEEDDDEATKEDGEEGEEGEEDKEEDDQDDREDEDEAGSAIDENDYSIDKKTKVALTGDKDCEKECKDKDKKQPDANSNQFLIREGYTTEHRVAIMNREVKYLMSVGKHVLALPVCTEAILLNQSPLSYLNRAHIYKSLKQYEEAIQDFTTVIEHDSINTAASYCQRGICYSKLLDYESAIEDLNKSYQVQINIDNQLMHIINAVKRMCRNVLF
jgi:tetratricopeptide (TPR) repeat protein